MPHGAARLLEDDLPLAGRQVDPLDLAVLEARHEQAFAVRGLVETARIGDRLYAPDQLAGRQVDLGDVVARPVGGPQGLLVGGEEQDLRPTATRLEHAEDLPRHRVELVHRGRLHLADVQPRARPVEHHLYGSILAELDLVDLGARRRVEHLDAVAAKQRDPQLLSVGGEDDLFWIGPALEADQTLIEQALGVQPYW